MYHLMLLSRVIELSYHISTSHDHRLSGFSPGERKYPFMYECICTKTISIVLLPETFPRKLFFLLLS